MPSPQTRLDSIADTVCRSQIQIPSLASCEPRQPQQQAMSYAAAARHYAPLHANVKSPHRRSSTATDALPSIRQPTICYVQTDAWHAPTIDVPATIAGKLDTATATASTARWECVVSPSTRHAHSGLKNYVTPPTTQQKCSGHPEDLAIYNRSANWEREGTHTKSKEAHSNLLLRKAH